MVIPLQVLAVLSAIAGLMGIPHRSWLEHWLEPVIPLHDHAEALVNPNMEWVLMAVSVVGAVVGIGFALKTYQDLKRVQENAKSLKLPHQALENKWYIDEIYDALLVRPIQKLSEILWKGFDVAVIDRIVLAFGLISQRVGSTVRLMQTGSIQIYAVMLLIGLVVTAGYLVYGWT
jgi:NADH-quinone oxidoreductase subunit L